MTDQELLARADAIAPRAYSPYSKFQVGCALLARDGTVFDGVNVENAAYPLGICAEKNGIGTAVNEGYGVGDFEVIAITHSRRLGSCGRRPMTNTSTASKPTSSPMVVSHTQMETSMTC